MSSAPGEVLNELFVQKLGTAEGKEKIAALGSDYIRDHLREESFLRKILPPKNVTTADLQRSPNHDTMVKLVEVEPESQAMTLSFRGQPGVRYYTGGRFEVAFHQIGSERYEQTEEELRSYVMPITEIIRRHIVFNIHDIEDRVGLGHFESATQCLQKLAGIVAGPMVITAQFGDTQAFTCFNIDAATVQEVGKCKSIDTQTNFAAAGAAASLLEDLIYPIQKDDFIKLFQLFAGRGLRGSRLRPEQFLITDTDFEDINSWTDADVSDDIVKETTVDGYKYKTVIGRKMVKTLKTDVLRPGNIYAFASSEFLGAFMIWDGTKFYADKERNRISFEAWENVGAYVGNIAGVRKLELYAGSVDDTSTANVAFHTKYLPLPENQLGRRNNAVEEGGVFPLISQF